MIRYTHIWPENIQGGRCKSRSYLHKDKQRESRQIDRKKKDSLVVKRDKGEVERHGEMIKF